ncbi:UNVERIFIED_CONTAM: hypothetical protein RMT77_014052 [Armadillidium vulgare]
MAQCKGFGLDLEILKRLSRDKLIRILEEASGPKELIIDGDLVKLLDRIADANILRVHGVGKMFRLERIPPITTTNQLVYLIRPTPVNTKYMADHVHSLRQQQPQILIHLVCVPRIVSWATQLIEEEGLYGIISVHEFSPEFIPLDEDLLSLEMQSFFRDALLDGDFSGCVSIAKALYTVQSLYGSFSNIVSHGRASHAVIKAFEKIKEDHTKSKINNLSPNSASMKSGIGHLFVFDREADFVTPLLSQLTYEGALDEHYGIRAGVVEFPKDVIGSDHPSKVPLNSRDSVFDNIRNRHFAGVASHLARKARELQDRKQTTSSMTPSQMKDFVTNDLRTIQAIQKSLSLHISACEGITKNMRKDFDVQLTTEHGLVTGAVSSSEAKSYIEDCLARQVPSKITLRLLCLYSITQNGLNRRDYEALSIQVLKSHGYQHMLTLFKLRKMGLLIVEETGEESKEEKQKQVIRQMVLSIGNKKSNSWCVLAKKLKLIPDAEESIDLHNPTHMSYVFNGAYTPLIPHLISECLSKGPGSIVDTIKLIPGASDISITVDGTTTPIPKVAVVLILGGITFAEIAALRLLSVSLSTKMIIASTSTTTGTSLISSAVSS